MLGLEGYIYNRKKPSYYCKANLKLSFCCCCCCLFVCFYMENLISCPLDNMLISNWLLFLVVVVVFHIQISVLIL